MILSLEDFAIITGLLTPVYLLAWMNVKTIAKIDMRLTLLENAHSRIHAGEQRRT